ncbi:MAG: hypothetical protein ACI4F1_14245 [Bariatricus sp.]
MLELVLLAGVAAFASAHLFFIAGYRFRYGLGWDTFIFFAAGYMLVC